MHDRGLQVAAISVSAAPSGGPMTMTPSASVPPGCLDGAGASGAQPRNSRRHMGQEGRGGSLTTSAATPGAGGLSHSASERRTAATGRTGGGLTPRRGPSDTNSERGRASPGSTSGMSKKEVRDRSLGAMPRSPRPKARDVIASVEVPSSRRRTMPPAPAVGRATSEEARNRASWRRRSGEGEGQQTASLAQKVPRSRLLSEADSGDDRQKQAARTAPQTARQRR